MVQVQACRFSVVALWLGTVCRATTDARKSATSGGELRPAEDIEAAGVGEVIASNLVGAHEVPKTEIAQKYSGTSIPRDLVECG